MTNSQTGQEADGAPSQAEVLRRLWKEARRPYEILRAGFVERGLDRAFDDLNNSIREASLLQATDSSRFVGRSRERAWQWEKNRLVAVLDDAIRPLINDGLYVVLMQTDVGLMLLEPEARRSAVFAYEHDWVRVGDKVFRDVRLVPAWHVRATEVKLLAGTVTTHSIKEARRQLRPSAAVRVMRESIGVALRPAAANDDTLVPPSRRPKRRPPDYDALLKPANRRSGPQRTYLQHLDLMEERAKQGILEMTLATEIKRLIQIALARKFVHRPAVKTLKNALGERYRELKPKKPS